MKDISGLISSMSLAEKVGQLFMLAFAKQHTAEAQILIEEHVVSGCYLSNDNLPNAETALALTHQLQTFAQNTRLQIPLLFSPDQEGTWAVMVPDSCPGPGNLALGASHKADNAYNMYRTIGQELSAVGLNAPFCPCVDCNTNPHNAIIGMRSFGENPKEVAAMTSAAVKGLKDGGVLATLKHFPGHGDTYLDSHRGLPLVERSKHNLLNIDLLPFTAGIRAGADIVMTSHIIYSALDEHHPATLSAPILQDLLRGELGFQGVIVSDSMNMHSMKKNYAPEDAAIKALKAGVDMIMLAEEHYDHDETTYLANQIKLIEAVKRAVESGVLSMGRVDDAVGRILKLKQSLPAASLDSSRVGLKSHREVELQVARDAVAVFKDDHQHIPIAAQKNILVVNTTSQDAYEVLGNIRGVGPNQTTAAFDYFARALKEHYPEVKLLSAEDVLMADTSLEADIILAVTENHTLPGMDFNQKSQKPIIDKLMSIAKERLVVVALRDPYEFSALNHVPTYLCAFSFRPCAAQAAVEVLLGKIEPKGRSPVSVPQTQIKA